MIFNGRILKKGVFIALKGRNTSPWVEHYNDFSPERASHKITIIKSSSIM